MGYVKNLFAFLSALPGCAWAIWCRITHDFSELVLSAQPVVQSVFNRLALGILPSPGQTIYFHPVWWLLGRSNDWKWHWPNPGWETHLLCGDCFVLKRRFLFAGGTQWQKYRVSVGATDERWLGCAASHDSLGCLLSAPFITSRPGVPGPGNHIEKNCLWILNMSSTRYVRDDVFEVCKRIVLFKTILDTLQQANE